MSASSPAPEPAGPQETAGPEPAGPQGSAGPVPLVLASRRPAGGRGRPPRHLADLPLAERRAVVAGLGQPPFRASQLSRHFFGRYTDRPEEMSDLPLAARDPLAQALLPRLLTPERELACDGGTTRKTLWRTFDGALVESVLMRYPDRVTMCVSSQAGCGMACPFCATGQAGLTRNLSTAEIVAQVVAGARLLADGQVPGGPGRVSNVVFMGMGEPLANYASVLAAVRRLTEPVPEGMGISQRSITVSTVGLVPAIARLAAERLSVTLAVSLHAPDDELRDTLVPVNRRWKVAEVLDAAWDYAAATGRRVSIEYALIRDINDQAWRADLLGSLLAGRLAHVNLIPLNPTPGSKWTASRPAAQREFVRRLEAHGVPVTVRDTRGREIDGACGQLAASASASIPQRRPAAPRPAHEPPPRAALAGGALGLPDGAAGRSGDRGHPGRAEVRRVRPRLDGGVPARFGLRRALDHGRRGHPDRRPGEPVRRDGARPGPRPGAGAADRGPLRDRPRQPHRRAPLAGHRGRRVHRPVRLHHRPEPRLRRPGRPHRQADAEQRLRPHRLGQLARAGAVVLPGACIGRNVVIAAGSVVRGTVPDRCVVAGVPARVVRSYVPGDGWLPLPKPVAPASASASAWTGLGAARAERVEGVAQPVDPAG